MTMTHEDVKRAKQTRLSQAANCRRIADDANTSESMRKNLLERAERLEREAAAIRTDIK